MKHERGKERGTILNTLVKMSLPRIEKGKKNSVVYEKEDSK